MRVKLEQGDERDGELASVVVCPRTKGFAGGVPGALQGTCSKCGEAVTYSRTSPAKPPKVCMDCALPEMIRQETLEVITTPSQRAELEQLFPGMFPAPGRADA